MIPMVQFVLGVGIGILGLGFLMFRQRALEAPQRSREEEPIILYETKETKPGESCVICLVEMKSSDIHRLPCRHALHKKCFAEVVKQTEKLKCPICWESCGRN